MKHHHLTTLAASIAILASAPVLAKKPTLTIYTYDSFTSEWGPGPQVKQAFEQQCHCTLKYVPLEDGVSILNRVRLEGVHTKADIVLGLDNNLMTEAQKTHLFAPSPVSLSTVNVPNGWHNQTFIPFDYGYFAFVYNKNRLKNPPQSLHDLVENHPQLKIIYEDPRTSTPGQGLLLWMKSVYGEKSKQAWQQLAKKTVTVTKGWSEAYSMFLKGEADMVLSYTSSPAYHIIAENKHQYAAANFSEGNYLQVEVAAKVKGTTHTKLADEFLNFMLTPAFQSLIPTTNWMYPVTNVTLPKGYEQLTIPKRALMLSPKQVAEHRRDWVREWQRAVAY
ncbi:MAG: thiamine ABC transporter substrate binding subunit [Vibrio sp.]